MRILQINFMMSLCLTGRSFSDVILFFNFTLVSFDEILEKQSVQLHITVGIIVVD